MANVKYNISNLEQLDRLISQFPGGLTFGKNKIRSTSKGMGKGKKIINKLQTKKTKKLYQVYNKDPYPFTEWLMNIINECTKRLKNTNEGGKFKIQYTNILELARKILSSSTKIIDKQANRPTKAKRNNRTGAKYKKNSAPINRSQGATKGNSSQIYGLQWIGNSCYADSVLVALFAVPNRFTDKLLDTKLTLLTKAECGNNSEQDLIVRRKIQNELKRITNSIRGEGNYVKHITPLRKLFEECPSYGQDYHLTNTQDAGEFLKYILKMFPFLDTAQDESITFGTNNTNRLLLKNMNRSTNFTKTSHNFHCYENVIMTVNSETLINAAKNQNIDTFLTIYDDSIMANWLHTRKIKIKRRIYTPYLIFDLMRGYQDSSGQKINIISINPIEEINLGRQTFNLSAIVILYKAHYTCVFKYNELWYHYDDYKLSYGKYRTKKIGNYEDMLKYKFSDNVSPKTHGKLYFYVPSNDIEPPICPPSINAAALKTVNHNWTEYFNNNTGKYYYYNPKTGISQWEVPKGYINESINNSKTVSKPSTNAAAASKNSFEIAAKNRINELQTSNSLTKANRETNTNPNILNSKLVIKNTSQYTYYGNILEAWKELLDTNFNVYTDIMKVFMNVEKKYYNSYGIPGYETIEKDNMVSGTCIGTEEQLIKNKVIFSFKDFNNSKFINKDKYVFFMRHSIRAEQYSRHESKKSNNRLKNYRFEKGNYIIDISKIEESTIYNIFYPYKISWNTEPVLDRLGMFLAYAEGIKMRKCNISFDYIISSPYIRCIQTAIMVSLALGNQTIYIDKKIGEFNHESIGEINFYNNYPSRGQTIEYNGIEIISDGITEDEIKYKRQNNEKFFTKENFDGLYNSGSKDKNRLYIGHNNFTPYTKINGVKYVTLGPFAYVVGKHNSSNSYYSSRCLGQLR